MKIALPQQKPEHTTSLENTLSQRETKREYLDTPLSLAHLSRLLFVGQGRRADSDKLLAPSAQEQYPISTFVVSHRVTGLSPGLYQYHSSDHALNELESGDFSERLENAAIGYQPWVGNAAAIVVLASNIQAMNQHFAAQPPLNERGERYSYIEVGAVAQNMQLLGTALNIGMVLVGGFYNDKVKSVLNLPPQLEPSALLCLGNV